MFLALYKMQLNHMHYNLRKHFFSNGIFAVFQTLLLMQSLLTYLKIICIDYGLIRNLNLIGMLILPELEA